VFMDRSWSVTITPTAEPLAPEDPVPPPPLTPYVPEEVAPDPPVIRPRLTVDHLPSQRAMGQIELDDNGNPTDGIHEVVLDCGDLITDAQMLARANAELEVFAWPIVRINYATRDRKSKPGRLVNVDLAHPPISGTFVIQTVGIDQIHDADGLPPRYTCSASSVRFELEDLLLLIASGGAAGPSFSTQSLVSAAVAMVKPIQSTIAAFHLAEISPTPAQMANAFSVPIQVVPAPGIGKTIIPFQWYLEQEIGATPFTGNPAYALRHDGNLPTLLAVSNIPLQNSPGRYDFLTGAPSGTASSIGTHPGNRALTAYLPGGNVLNGSGTFRIGVFYCIVNAGT